MQQSGICIKHGKQFPISMNKVIFISKRINESVPWVKFGCDTQEEYEKWLPHVCGICCLKMIGDTVNKTNRLSLYQLTLKCLSKGGFKILNDGKIEGVFHYPLLQLAVELGLSGEVKKCMDNKQIIESVTNNRFIILSVDLKKIDLHLVGSHLLLIYGCQKHTNKFILHDTSAILSKTGQAVLISGTYLEKISNKKGLIIWDSGI